MIPADKISINETGADASETVISRQNMNLSSVVSTIRDDGPSTAAEPLLAGVAVNDATGTPEPVPAPKPDTAAPVTRVRALPGKAVMLRVLSVLLFSGLVTGSVLLANGKYPALDERGLYLAELPASMPDWMVSIGTGVHDKALQWQQEIKALLTAKPATSPPTLPYDAAAVEDLAAWQQQLTTRLNELADSIDTLQLRFEHAQAERAVGSMVLQTGQARQLEAMAAQLASLQQQVTGTKQRLPESTRKQSGKKKQPETVPVTAPARSGKDTVAKQQPSASQSVAGQASPNKPAGDTKPLPASKATGGWVVNVASSSQRNAIEALQRKLRQQDIRTELQQLERGGASRYRLRVTGFASGGEARRYAAGPVQKAGIEGAWVSKR